MDWYDITTGVLLGSQIICYLYVSYLRARVEFLTGKVIEHEIHIDIIRDRVRLDKTLFNEKGNDNDIAG